MAKRKNRPPRLRRNQEPPKISPKPRDVITHKDLADAAAILKRGDKPSPAEVIIRRTCTHPEAYCLMKYQCGKCQTIEELWNSRDGVTPFIIGCRKCDGSMQHIDWQDDRRVPHYVPQPGQRVFIDLPESLKEPLVRWQIGQRKRKPDNVEELVMGMVRGFQPDEPWIIEWPV